MSTNSCIFNVIILKLLLFLLILSNIYVILHLLKQLKITIFFIEKQQLFIKNYIFNIKCISYNAKLLKEMTIIIKNSLDESARLRLTSLLSL